MIKFAEYKEQYRATLRLAAPVVMSQAGILLVQLVDTAMVGRLGAIPLAGVSFGSTVFFFIFIFSMGLSMGLTPLVGEMYATGNHKSSARYFQNSLLLYFVVGLLAVALQLATIPLMHHMGQPPEVVAQAIPYYRYMVWSMIPLMIYCAFKQFLEGVGNTKVTMYTVITANAINILLNWLLIYGKWGFPQMGAAGAGLATMISRAITPVMMLIYFVSAPKFRRYLSFFSRPLIEWRRIANLLRVGFPIAAQMLLEGGTFALTTLMMGWIGTLELAGNKIAMDIANMAFMMIQGIAAATTIRVSHEFGRRNMRELRLAAGASYHIQLAWNALTALLFISLRNYIPRIFTDDPDVIRMASHLLIFVAAFQFSDGLQVISIGVLRGMQDVKSIMSIAFLSYVVINIPLGCLLAFVLDWGPGGLWTGLIVGLSTAALLLMRRYRRQYKLLTAKYQD